jgi:hypothetical protein
MGRSCHQAVHSEMPKSSKTKSTMTAKHSQPKPARTAKPRKPVKVWAMPYALNHLKGSGSAAIGPCKWYPSDMPFILFDASPAAHAERLRAAGNAVFDLAGMIITRGGCDALAAAALAALHKDL